MTFRVLSHDERPLAIGDEVEWDVTNSNGTIHATYHGTIVDLAPYGFVVHVPQQNDMRDDAPRFGLETRQKIPIRRRTS